MSPFTEEKVVFEVMATAFNGEAIVAFTSESAGQDVLSMLCTSDFRDWRPLPSPAGMVYCFSLFSFQEELYAAFCSDGYGKESRDGYPVLYKLVSLVSGEWKEIPNGLFPRRRLACASVVWEDKLLVIGGSDCKLAVPTVDMYDLANQAWCDPAQFSLLPVGLVYGKAMVHRNQSHVTGGVTTRSLTRDPNTTVYTSTVNSASTSPQHKWVSDVLPATPHGDCGVLSVEDSPVVAGGVGTSRGTLSPEVFCFDVVNETWLQLPSLQAPRASPSLVLLGDKLVAIGGCTKRFKDSYAATVEVMQLNF